MGSAEALCQTITKLALTSKAADNVMKTIKVVENTCLNNEVTIEELDKNLRATVKMASDNEQKLDELSRKLGVQEAELKRAVERAELAEKNLKGIEEELETVGDNMKQLEKSAEKAWRERRNWWRRSTTSRASTRPLRPSLSTER